jgi:hypothetical protein
MKGFFCYYKRKRSNYKGNNVVGRSGFMGRKNLRMQVTDFIPNRKIVIEALEGMQLLPLQNFEFFQEGNKTRINLFVQMKVKGPFKLIQFMLPGKLKKNWSEYFKNLGAVVTKVSDPSGNKSTTV